MKLAGDQLREILIKSGHIKPEEFVSAEKRAKEAGKDIEGFLVEEGVLSDSQLGKIIADSFGWKFIDLREEKIAPEVFQLIPEIVARAQETIVFDRSRDRVRVATAHPDNYEVLKLVEKKTGQIAEVYYATPRAIEDALRYYKSDFFRLINVIIAELRQKLDEERVVSLVDMLLEYAYHSRASDIHLEPGKEEVKVRFRVDGVMHEVFSYFKELHDRLVFRIKILSRLRTDEHALPQDGKFQYQKEDILFDIRVSVVPITTGENIVMRLLLGNIQRFRLEELGLLERDFLKVEAAIRKPYGMILSAGPTGSGKTTSLYAVTQLLNRPEVNIMTIEDPVEYEIGEVNQIQVNAKTGLTFVSGLRSIVRQDPDIIYVGEIRDNETADIAVNAALTGHLLLSSIHANDSGTVFPRLVDLGVAPFLVASSVNVVIAQRLVRKICPHCIETTKLDPHEVSLLSEQKELLHIIKDLSGTERIEDTIFYKGKGCKSCEDLGFLGRTGIFEVLEVADEIKPLIVEKKSSNVIRDKAIEQGMTSMLYDGIIKVFLGITTLSEVIRVTKI